jgi:shikimate kinase
MNIVLIGMPGCGKSTVGVLLAKALLMDFIDTDLVIQNKYGKSLCEIIAMEGTDAFKNIENKILCELKMQNTVVATGGSAVYGADAMKNLSSNGVVVYIKLSPSEIKSRIKNITTRGIAMEKGTTIEELYIERSHLYEKYADITIDSETLNIEETTKAIKKAVETCKK